MNRGTRTFIVGIFWAVFGIYQANEFYQEGLEGFWSYFWFIACVIIALNGFNKIDKTTD